ncbi:chitin deacetylase 7-like [Ixodes scapularis]|uniref:chitin deacetylase 7-like n=1 Tax=Ixodes scapularis TaxID=6945 RepID=UPI001C3843A7|nr:chitin deacetylase 7-like [Ixodes scapularis]
MNLCRLFAVLLLGCLRFAASLPPVLKEIHLPNVEVSFASLPSNSDPSVQDKNKLPSHPVVVGDTGATNGPSGPINTSQKEKLVITVERTSNSTLQISQGGPQCSEGTSPEGKKCVAKGALETLLSVADELKRYLGDQTGSPRDQTTLVTTETPAGTTSTVPPKIDTKLYRPEHSGCDVHRCRSPNCACSGELPPGGLTIQDTPQFVMLTFNHTVHRGNMPFFNKLLGGSHNRNKATGCDVLATFFVSADVDYKLMNDLYLMGNEIALHTISNRNDPDFWKSLSPEEWGREVDDQRKMLKVFGNIAERDLKGFSGPFLNTGGENGFKALQSNAVEYDNSLVHLRRRGEDYPLYPYTLDFGFKMPCVVEPCPQDPYPGLWVFPVNVYLKSEVVDGQDREVPCPIGAACEPQPTTAIDTLNYLRSHFEQHYNTNRAPFQLSLSEEWLKDPKRQKGYMVFVKWLLQKEDVHLVTMSQALEFMRNPVPLSRYNQRQCERHDDRTPCSKPTKCSYPTTPLGHFRFMNTCSGPCPPNFPWLKNPLGH